MNDGGADDCPRRSGPPAGALGSSMQMSSTRLRRLFLLRFFQAPTSPVLASFVGANVRVSLIQILALSSGSGKLAIMVGGGLQNTPPSLKPVRLPAILASSYRSPRIMVLNCCSMWTVLP